MKMFYKHFFFNLGIPIPQSGTILMWNCLKFNEFNQLLSKDSNSLFLTIHIQHSKSGVTYFGRWRAYDFALNVCPVEHC